MENGPIFIGGLDRSGKTLLRRMLSRHPRLSLTRKTYMWSRFYNQYGDLAQPENLERCLQAMLQQKTIQAFEPDVDRIRREFGEGPATYERLFALFHKHNAERLGKPRWGDQLKLVERFAETIFAAYPDAKMIHMVRDPRDRYAAAFADIPRGKKTKRPDWRAGWSVARWLYSARLAEHNRKSFPERYLVLHYEALMLDPGKTLRIVCDFLGEA
ncbi:MAG TPA: sulfotransferase, partial [Terriglobales bacterium]